MSRPWLPGVEQLAQLHEAKHLVASPAGDDGGGEQPGDCAHSLPHLHTPWCRSARTGCTHAQVQLHDRAVCRRAGELASATARVPLQAAGSCLLTFPHAWCRTAAHLLRHEGAVGVLHNGSQRPCRLRGSRTAPPG